MANRTLFNNTQPPRADSRNEAGGSAYRLSPEQALAQYVMTGCMNNTFYAGAQEQLDTVLHYCGQVDAPFIAKLALHARQRGYMKDMPALLAAVLSCKDNGLLRRVFHRVIDNGKMLRNFVQIMRSGQTGRKSLGSGPRNLVRDWLATRTTEQLFRASVGQSPSLADVVKMVHPKPADEAREAFYHYLLGRETDLSKLPETIQAFEHYKAGQRETVPDVPFQMLTALPLGSAEWRAIARNAPWQMTRMNLNTFARHGVFDDARLTRQIAARLRNPELIRKAGAFPYQLMAAYVTADKTIPAVVHSALEDALEIAVSNVPEIRGKVYVCPDVSGSMSCAVTGERKGATSAIRCIDVAALLTAAILRANRNAEVLPFDTRIHNLQLDPWNRIMANAQKLARLGGGGTNCSLPLQRLNKQKATGDVVIYISDNESWADRYAGRGTGMMAEWEIFRQRNRQARLICLDIQPYGTVQAKPRNDVLHIGGFSDAVFDTIAVFAKGQLNADYWVKSIRKVSLEEMTNSVSGVEAALQYQV
jgi:60 kDa SS-A/Ro ribonucleoprotein